MGVWQALGLAGRRALGAPAFCYKDIKNLGFLTAGRLLAAYLDVAVNGRRRPMCRYKLKSLRLKGYPYPVWYRPGTSDCLAIHHVLADREYSPIGRPAAPKLIVDCGANIGCASLFFLNEFPDAHVLAVESDEENYEMCRKNLAGFGDRVRVKHAAVSATDTCFVVEKGADGEWSNTVRPCRPGESGTVAGITLGQVLDDSPYGQIDILKVDIEGAEQFLFGESCGRWLARTKNLVIELHDDACRTVFFRAMRAYECELSTRKNLTFCRDIRPRPAGSAAALPLGQASGSSY